MALEPQERDMSGFNRPINPPFVFRDPDNFSLTYGEAHSLEELEQLLPLVPFSIIEYHLYRLDQHSNVHCDLCNWIRYIIKNPVLALRIRKLAIAMFDPMKAKKELVSIIRTANGTEHQA